MKLVKHLLFSPGIVVAALVWFGSVEQARAAFTLTGTAAELVARGINADFEAPAHARGDGEVTSTNNIGTGWTFNLMSGIASNYGVQDPNNTFYGTVATGPLPTPFEGLQLGFYNLNNPFSQAEIISNPIGQLRAGETYTLNVAVGTRNTTAMNEIAYRVGLRATDGADLGAFATAVMVPNTNPASITDLQYTLNMSSVPSYVGDEARIVIGAYNTGNNPSGVYASQNAQANFDNARLTGTFDDLPATPSASLTINRQTGAISLSNLGSSNLNILGYSLTSVAGSFDQSAWRSVANNYDQPSAPTPGNGSVDNNDPWTVLSASASTTNLSESEFSDGGDGGALSTGSPVDLGNAWLRTPFQDVQGNLLLGDGSQLPIAIQYGGVAIPSGDLNGDGNITGADWTLFKAGQGTNFTGMSKAQAYLKGDLTGNLTHDLGDFFAFRTAYDAANGAGSFAGVLAAVPEPRAGLLFALGSLLTFIELRQRNRWRRVLSMNCISKIMCVAIVAATKCVLTAQPAAAQSGIAHWSFDAPSLAIEGGNITGAADKTGNHNATVSGTGIGGASGTANVSGPFAASDSVTGKFGQGLRFNGNNFMVFPNLTELMTASGAPNYSVSMWMQWLSATAPPTSSPFSTMGDWGNAAANSGVAGSSSRFVYAFGPQSATQMRHQSRHHLTSGNGTDIFVRNANVTPNVDDDSWHMFTWTFDTTSGVLSSYYDGALVDTFTSTAASFQMANSTSAVGTFGLKGDSSTFLTADTRLDEVYVFNGVLTQQQISDLYNLNSPPADSFPEPINLTLRVDPADGQVEIRNSSAGDVAFSAYRITSSTGALNRSGWDAISTGTPIPGFPQGNGSGNGWEAPGGGGNPADYNANGTVDAADYVLWRENNINGPQGYSDWRANFGAAGTGSGGSDSELVEWYLTGESTLAVGGAISLGQAFDVGGNQNLTFQFTTSTGVRTGLIEYGAIGSGLGAAVPEPASCGLMLLACCGLAARIWRRRLYRCPVVTRVAACLLVTSVAGSSALATITNDRIHRFGENGIPPQTQENATAGMPVGSGAGNPAPGATLDHIGPSGSFQTLLALANGGGALPVYQGLSGLGRSGLGILFDGTDDYLSGFSLGLPPLSRGTINGGGTGTLNYNGVYQRGFQLWAYPHSGATAEQHVVSDNTEHGVRISSGGNWILRHGGTNVNSNVPATFNQWSHVMAAMPVNSQPHRAVLYINGVAITAHEENYNTTAEVNAQALIVGANTDANGTLVGTTNHFRGVLDELEMFIWGRGYNHLTGAFTDFGTFNFATDNGYAASTLSGVPGDVNNTGGAPTQADVDAFVAGWLSEKRVNNIRVGDLTTFAKGDLNFDGITNLTDAHLLMQALPGSGRGGGLDLRRFGAVTGLAIPEPSLLGLTALSIAGLITMRRRRNK